MFSKIPGIKTDGDIEKLIESEIIKIQTERKSRTQNDATFMIAIEGVAELKINQDLYFEKSLYSFCYDAVDKIKIKEWHRDSINFILASIIISAKNVYGIKEVTDGLYFDDGNGKPLFTSRLIVSAQGFPYIPITNGMIISSESNIQFLKKEKFFKNIVSLYVQSFDESQTEFIRFVNVWAALEIFINNIFNKYKESFFSDIYNKEKIRGIKFISSIDERMKYTKVHKFALISYYLGANPIEEVEFFKSCKALRDKVYHSKPFSDNKMPVEDLRNLLTQYLIAYLNQGKSGL